MDFDDVTKIGELAVANYNESIEFVRNYETDNIDEQMKFALVADTLELFNDTVLDASNMVSIIAQICAMCTPTEMLSDYLNYMRETCDQKELDQISQVLSLISLYIQMLNDSLDSGDD